MNKPILLLLLVVALLSFSLGWYIKPETTISDSSLPASSSNAILNSDKSPNRFSTLEPSVSNIRNEPFEVEAELEKKQAGT